MRAGSVRFFGFSDRYEVLLKGQPPAYTDGVLENGIGAFYLMYSARQGEDISTSLDSYQTTYQKMIEDANKRIG